MLQCDGDDKKPVVYVSRKLFPRETRYTAVELERLAVRWALDILKYYLLRRDFYPGDRPLRLAVARSH